MVIQLFQFLSCDWSRGHNEGNNEARASYLILKLHLSVNQRKLGHRIEDKQIASFNEQKLHLWG